MLITKQLLVAIDLKTTREVNGYQELFGYNHVEERKKIKQVCYEISEGKRWLTFPFGFNRPFKLFFSNTNEDILGNIFFFLFGPYNGRQWQPKLFDYQHSSAKESKSYKFETWLNYEEKQIHLSQRGVLQLVAGLWWSWRAWFLHDRSISTALNLAQCS